MGKASSSKKVARAAGIGGGRGNRRRLPWGFYSLLVVVALLGVVGTVTSRNARLSSINSQGNTAPTVGTTWNEGYAVYECGKFVPAIRSNNNPEGIHTSGDGIIHIHPTVKAAAGKNATLGKFADAVGMKLNAAELQVPGGQLYQNGDRCSGKAAQVYVKEFAYIGDNTGTLQTVDPRTIRLQDQALLTIAFVPASDKNKIPPPPQYVQDNLKKLAASPTTTTTAPGPGTTAPAGVTTTTAPATTTTTKPATTSATAHAATTTSVKR